MAHEWDSYFQNIPPLPSDPSTLRRTTETEGCLSQHIENFIGHHDFSNTVDLPGAAATSSHFGTDYYSNPRIGNSRSDCVYERYYSETPWETDGQMVKDHLPRRGDGDIPDFATNGLPSSEPFPSSLTNDLQGLKQDCEMLAQSLLEDYSDVSSCSDADAGETRPSCKFMKRNPVPKPKIAAKNPQNPPEWHFTHTGNIAIPNEINSIMPNSSKMTGRENIVGCVQDEIKTVKPQTGQDQSPSTSSTTPTTESETLEDNNDRDGCQVQGQNDNVETDVTQEKYSNISTRPHGNLTGDGMMDDLDDNEEGRITAPNTMAISDEKDHLVGKIPREKIKECYQPEKNGLDNPYSIDHLEKNVRLDEPEKSEVFKRGLKEICSLPNGKETPSNTPQISDPHGINESDDKDTVFELKKYTNTLESQVNSHDAGSSLQLSEHQPVETVAQDNISGSPAVISDPGADSRGLGVMEDLATGTCDNKNPTVANNFKTCLQPNTSCTNDNPSLKEKSISPSEMTNTSSTDCSDLSSTSDSPTNDNNEQHAGSSSTHTNSVEEEQMTSKQEEKHDVSSTESDGTTLVNDIPSIGTCDENKQSISNNSESCLARVSSSEDLHLNVDRDRISPAEKQGTTSSPRQQQSPYQSPAAEDPENGKSTENTRVVFEELDTSTEEQFIPGMLYGEPLSGEDSCDTDESKLHTSPEREVGVAIPNIDSFNRSKEQDSLLKSSLQMTKRMQPVIIIRKESAEGMSDSYHCASCQHITQGVDHLIEHHYCCHSVHNFQFCQICNLYLMKKEPEEKHLCDVTKQRPQLSVGSCLKTKRKRYRPHQCKQCGLIFQKLFQYVKHMRNHTGKTPYKCDGCGLFFAQNGTLTRHRRIPGRCKRLRRDTKSKDVISVTETPPQKELVDNKPLFKLPECYVMLVDITKGCNCRFCGKEFSASLKLKQHLNNVHKQKSLEVSRDDSAIEQSAVKTEKDENKTSSKYKCPLCPRVFKYSYNRARHLRNCVMKRLDLDENRIGKRYRCPLCYITFISPSIRYRHVSTACIRMCLSRLIKARAKSIENANQKTNKTGQKKGTKEKERKEQSEEIEQKKQTKEKEQKTQSKEKEQKKTPTPTSGVVAPRFKCKFCPAAFSFASGKYRHMKKHEVFKLTGKKFMYRNSVPTMSKLTTLISPKTEEGQDDLKPPEEQRSLSMSCHFCGKCFRTSQSLKNHVQTHGGERPYLCLECGRVFRKRVNLISHTAIHKRRIQCTVCKKIFPTLENLIQHSKLHSEKRDLQCPDCPLHFQYPSHFLRHVATHQKMEHLELLEQEPQELVESVEEQGEPNPLQCSLCKQVLKDGHALRKHCLAHISGSSLCPFCNQDFASRRYLLRHMVKHTGEKPFSCTYCGKQFYRDQYLKLHYMKCAPGQNGLINTSELEDRVKGPEQCSFCPRVFTKKDRLKSHLRGHKLDTLHLCEKCGQYYGFCKVGQHRRKCVGMPDPAIGSPSTGSVCKSTSQPRRNIIQRPSEPKTTNKVQFKCPHCTRTFRFKSLLLRHLVSHTGLQPYPCMYCGNRYGTRSLCLQHESYCNGDNKEGQPRVERDSATTLSNMTTFREAARKPPEKPEGDYKCKFCTKTFMKSRNLRRHILTHNEVKPYHCKACDSCFSRYDYLKVHQARCKGKRSRLEVCIPKISLDDVGKGWQNKSFRKPVQKPETFECENCSRSFPTHSKLSRHLTMFHTKKLFKCARCGTSFTHEKSMKKHKKMRKCRRPEKETNASLPLGDEPKDSMVSALRAVKSRVLHRILPTYNKKYKHVCSYCPRAFGNTWQLAVHIRLHTGERPYSCNYCGEHFIRKDYVQRHFPKCPRKKDCIKSCTKSTVPDQQTGCPSPKKGFSCAFCSSRFFLFSQLQDHFLSAHKLETMDPPLSTAPLQHHLSSIPRIKEEPIDDALDQQPSDGANLICKLDTAHTGEVTKTCVCTECNMSFANKAGLTGHQRVHSMEHPFHCKTCKKGFWNKSLLRNHNRKCRLGHVLARNSTEQSDVHLKADIDFALTDSVPPLKDCSETSDTEDLQTNVSCEDDLMEESSQKSDENKVESSPNREKKVVQYQCSECDMSFTDGLILISHLEDHGREEQEKKRNTCSKCGRVFTSRANLEKHMKSHGIDKKLSCPDCPKIVFTLADLETHSAVHNPNRRYACRLCNYRFWTRKSLGNHYTDGHPNKVFTCRICNKTYALKKSLVRHYKQWHEKEQKELDTPLQEKGSAEQSSSQVTGESEEDDNEITEDSDSDSAPYFPCHVCGKTFPTSESLEDHQRCHLGEKPHECAECGRCFFQASQLEHHQRMHKSEFKCQVCGRGFVSFFALRNHKHTHGKSRTYRCSKCKLFFTGPSQLAEHMSTHQEENFPCDICNQMFLSKSSRAEHRKKHSSSGDCPQPVVSSEEHVKSALSSESSPVLNKELKYRCGVCSGRFRDPEELSEHGCIASEERKYSCSDCDKYFLHASHLKRHRNTHHITWTNSEFPCNQCNNSYSSVELFLDHLKSHVSVTAAENKPDTQSQDGESSKSFICPICHRCFANATELIHHFPIHGGNTFKCKTCELILPSKRKLEEHERCHLTPAAESQERPCPSQRPAITATKSANTSANTSLPTSHHDAGEEEEVDVTGEDLYNCPVCSIPFSSKSGLLEHQNKVHQKKVKAFKCDVCGKTFALRRYLQVHRRRHPEPPPPPPPPPQKTVQKVSTGFKCSQCPTEFNTAQELSSHLRMHAEKEYGDYRCDMCYKSFKYLLLLKQHQESHVGQVVYECTECDKAFAFPHLLEEHQKTHA